MSSAECDTPPHKDFHTRGRNFLYEKPSPLRIVKCDRNTENDGRDTTSHTSPSGAYNGDDTQKQDESLAIFMKRKPNEDRRGVGKENIRPRLPSHAPDNPGVGDRQPSQEAKSWMQDGSPPRRLRFTPPPQLTIRKTRQARTHARTQPSPGHASSSPSSTFPAEYGMRRAVKHRPPLSNICGEAGELMRSPPSTLGNREREEAPITSSEPPPAAQHTALQRQPRLCYVLVPHVAITPEVAALEARHHSLWAAIEVSTRLWPISGRGTPPRYLCERSGPLLDPTGLSECDQHSGWKRGEAEAPTLENIALKGRQGDPFEFGHLLNLSVELLPTAKSSIVRVLQDQSFPITLREGSSILLLAQTHIDIRKGMRQGKPNHSRQKSEDLIEDLEAELGDSQVGYMEVRLSYSHSAFPTSRDPETMDDGVSSIQSKVETVATASVKLHNSMSPWSPPPAPALNPLLPLIERHWGVQRAREAMRQILALGYAPRKPARPAQAVGSRPKEEGKGEEGEEQENAPQPRMRAASPRAAPPPVPLRHASLQQDLNRDRETSRTGSYNARRVTSRCGHAASTCISTQSGRLQAPPSSVAGVDGHFTTPTREAHVPCVGLQSPVNSDGREDPGASVSSALWKRQSLGDETLRGLLPLIADLSMTARDREARGGRAREGRVPATPAVPVARAKGKKDAGRWAWGAWF